MVKGSLMDGLKEKRFFVSDLGVGEGEIELIIESDNYVKWLTGRRQCLNNGLVAVEACFGWTLSGSLEEKDDKKTSSSTLVTPMLAMNATVSYLWELEAIGIHDPVESRSRTERGLETKEVNVSSAVCIAVRRWAVFSVIAVD